MKGGRNSVFRLSSLFEKVHYPPNIDKQPELVGVVSFNFRDLLIADDAKYTSIMVPEIEP